jgi:hypothetical protein
MKYENLTRFNDGEFKRLVGVPRPLFLKWYQCGFVAQRFEMQSAPN